MPTLTATDCLFPGSTWEHTASEALPQKQAELFFSQALPPDGGGWWRISGSWIDVVTWVSQPLSKALTVRGPVTARLFVATRGTDADWVVKLIDVYPDDAPDSEMSGCQLMVSGDISRGRYRESYEEPRALEPDQTLAYSIPLPHVNHTFRPGQRLMVQVQSTWFPLYDRNPWTFVPSIMSAPPAANKPQRHRIYHDQTHATHLELLVDRTQR